MKGQARLLAMALAKQALVNGLKFHGDIEAPFRASPIYFPTRSRKIKNKILKRQRFSC